MGAIRGFINKNDQADSLVKEQNAHLDSLSEMANIKVNLFKEIITDRLINAGTGTDKTVPITQIQDFISNLNTLKSYGFHFCRDNKQTVEYYVITNWG